MNDKNHRPGQAAPGDERRRGAEPRWYARLPFLHLVLLIALSAMLTGLLEWADLPAAFLIGPMVAAVAMGLRGTMLSVPMPLFAAGQTFVGCMIAMSLSPDIFSGFVASWPIFLAAVIATLVASSLLGWLISRWNILPGTTAIWGSWPGAASAMVIMAGAFGADQRLVAFMQYLRVLMVSLGAAIIARLFVDIDPALLPDKIWFPPIEPIAFATMLGVAAAGAFAGRLLRLPAPYFLGPFILGTASHIGWQVPIQTPEWLLSAGYVVIGWTVGLKFDRSILRHALRALPQLILAILVLMAFCGAIAVVLTQNLGIDPLTAYLATSPGGMDSIAIIAAASDGVDLNFIMTMQALRFLIVLIFGAPIARMVARRASASD